MVSGRSLLSLVALMGLTLVMAPETGYAGGAVVETVSGMLIGPGVECPQFRLDDGEVISLVGAAPDQPGSYQLTGRWARFSKCMQGRSFQVQAVTPISQQEPSNGDAD